MSKLPATNPQQRASVNHGKPAVAATPRPGELKGAGVVPAREAGAPYHPPAGNRAGWSSGEQRSPPGNNAHAAHPENNVPRPPAPTHAKDLQPHERPAPPNTGNPKLDQKYQQQQDKLYAKQEQDHQKLQQKQEQEHQRASAAERGRSEEAAGRTKAPATDAANGAKHTQTATALAAKAAATATAQ